VPGSNLGRKGFFVAFLSSPRQLTLQKPKFGHDLFPPHPLLRDHNAACVVFFQLLNQMTDFRKAWYSLNIMPLEATLIPLTAWRPREFVGGGDT
jgi:hypothetical protein